MDINARIYVAGHRGLVGRALIKTLKAKGYQNILTQSHAELDLTRAKATEAFFQEYRPEYIFLAAARVGGIVANNHYRVEFLQDNLLIQTHVLGAAHRHGVKRLLFLGSSCIYPRECPQPIKEQYLLTGSLESTNQPYALAKITGIELCDAYNKQYNQQYLAVMPTNLYGPGDNYDLQSSHVIPALMRKMHEAKIHGCDEVEIWGTGNALREFLFSEDLADACVTLMTLDDHRFNELLKHTPPIVNVGWGKDISIKDLVHVIADVVGFKGQFRFNHQYPDGTPRKVLCTDRLTALGWKPKLSLREGLAQTYAAFASYEDVFSHDKSTA
jgi:GDP-L-fucose synthase